MIQKIESVVFLFFWGVKKVEASSTLTGITHNLKDLGLGASHGPLFGHWEFLINHLSSDRGVLMDLSSNWGALMDLSSEEGGGSHGPLLGLGGSPGPLLELGGSYGPFLGLWGFHGTLLGLGWLSWTSPIDPWPVTFWFVFSPILLLILFLLLFRVLKKSDQGACNFDKLKLYEPNHEPWRFLSNPFEFI